MKKLFFLITIIFSQSVWSVQISTSWNDDNRKYLNLLCSQEVDYICDLTCDSLERCELPIPFCADCVGTSIIMTFYLQEMGRYITNQGQAADIYIFTDLLRSGDFIAMTSRSIYNHIDSFNSPALQRRFRSLCDDQTMYPVVFFERMPSRQIGKPQMVWCESGISKLTTDPNIDFINQKMMGHYFY